METFLRDVRYGFRMLLKRPGFTVVAVAALALGIGANTTIFSVVNAVMLRPLPYADPARLVSAESVNSINPQREIDGVSPADFWDWKEQSQAFEQLAALSGGGGFSLKDSDQPDVFNGARVSFNFFQTFGVQPLLGRVFSAEDGQLNAPETVVLSHRLWMRRFGGDPSVVGKTFNTSNGGTTVIGVMPPDFKFPSYADVWTPLYVKQEELGSPTKPEVYVPYQQVPWFGTALVIRAASADPMSLKKELQQAIWEVDKDLPVSEADTVEHHLSDLVAEPRLYYE